MIYIMSDLHGCYEKYIQMLEKIKLNNNDVLYILGDIIDRGDAGIKILFDMMNKGNIIPLIGNHEYMAYSVLKKFNVEISVHNYNKHLDSEAIEIFEAWVSNGGITTLREFLKLDNQNRESVIKYLGEFDLYEELEVNGNKFVLVHGGLAHFDESKSLADSDISDMILGRCDYERQYYPDKYLVTGHTPTYIIDSEYKGKIYKKNNHIAIDCGAVYCGSLGCVCLNTMEEFYV